VTIQETRRGDVVILAPEGSLAAAPECATLEQKLAAVIDGQAYRLVVDFAGVEQVAGSALRVLLRTQRKLVPLQGRLVLCALNEKVRKAFSVSGFDNDFTLVATRPEAIKRAAEAVAAPAPAPATKTLPADAARATLNAAADRLQRLLCLGTPPLAEGWSENERADSVAADRRCGRVLSLLGFAGAPSAGTRA
jgi:anti-sigma B factor antagonist